MMLKIILSVTLPTTILLIILFAVQQWERPLGIPVIGILVVLAIVQAIFWKFVKWNF